MHLITYFCALLTLSVCWTSVDGLKCVCKPEECEPPTDCKWGSGPDVCSCCEVCRQGPGEECGGPWNIHGQCGSGLECVKENPKYEEGVGNCTLLQPEQ